MRLKPYLLWLSLLFFVACGNPSTPPKPPSEVVIAEKPEEVQVKASEQLEKLISFLGESNGKLNDSTTLRNYQLLRDIYSGSGYEPIWSENNRWKLLGDSLFHVIFKSKEFGLFPSDYHLEPILAIRNKFVIDTAARKNIASWTRADILLTDGFLQMARDLYSGRLVKDSITMRADSLSPQQLKGCLDTLLLTNQPHAVLEPLEPQHPGYKALRAALPGFLDSTQFRKYTYVQFPQADSMTLIREVARRLQEDTLLAADWQEQDSAAYSAAVRKYQSAHSIRTTGVAAELTVKSLNNTGWEKFKRIAINLDRYKQIPAKLPETYIWVNLPSFTLTLVDMDTIALQSKVIVGASKTRTPVLTSEIVNFITYPQWTVPYSIIFKEMLPKIQKDTNFLARQNLMVVDKNDSVISPSSIDWFKLNKNHFPYLIRQRQGDDNSLGVMKFNFRNKYAVYLHDTNARGLFSRSARALSHGCVRVQEWEKLAHFLVRNDEIRYHPDTLRAWISRQEKHVISDFVHVPIFIRYFTCEADGGRIKFFDDIYADDRMLAERYFRNKPIN
ncbi:L,D-transpeptidase family protein [Flavihumibacter petaseus]|uniref:Putative L,D-transpeptidase n=1 Tax=Flavihumibacter petaseus NBRC 106054 TaxID=1220578 RepID=A0A0E9N0H2_9BACT|nr:L,D-transpeptidase family protein [Flavihumibacter petaseus]GAO43278.1 putative L,D-transpeptidase [Flavihumibacter petaseus NBRC 106054]